MNEEKLPQLSSFEVRMRIYKEMMTDHVIGTLFDGLSFPILSAEFHVDDPTKTREGRRRADFAEEALNGMDDIDFRKHAEEMLDYMMYGFGIGEIVLRQNKEGKMVPDTIIPVAQESLWEWGDLDVRGRPTSFKQRDPVNGDLNEAPMSKLVHMTYRSRKRNPEGTGLLRSLWRPWYFRKNLEVLEAIGAERDVGNVPYAELDPDTALSEDEIGALEAVLGKIRIDETGYIIGAPGVKIKPFGSGGKVYDFRQIIQDWKHDMLRRYFADFLATDSEALGTSTTAKELTGFFALSLRFTQKSMTDAWNSQLIRFMFAHNPSFGLTERDDFPKLPKIVWDRVGRENVQALATTVSTLIKEGVMQPDDDLEDRFRNMMELPERKEGRTPEERAMGAGIARGGQPGMTGEDGATPNSNPTGRGQEGNRTRQGGPRGEQEGEGTGVGAGSTGA